MSGAFFQGMHHRKKSYVNQIGIISCFEIMQNRGLVQISQVAHVLTFLKLGWINLLNLILFEESLIFAAIQLDCHFVAFGRVDDAFDKSTFLDWNPAWSFRIVRLRVKKIVFKDEFVNRKLKTENQQSKWMIDWISFSHHFFQPIYFHRICKRRLHTLAFGSYANEWHFEWKKHSKFPRYHEHFKIYFRNCNAWDFYWQFCLWISN